MVLQTEFEFTLPKGYVGETGDLHRKGVMQLAAAADEILPMKRKKNGGKKRDRRELPRIALKKWGITRIK